MSERLGARDRHILDDPKWARIAYAIWSESVDVFESSYGDSRYREDALDIEDFFREICYIVCPRYSSVHGFSELGYSVSFYGESRSLTMPTISDKKMLALIQELDQIAPFRSTTGSDGEFFSFTHTHSGIYCDRISFATGEWVIVSIFHHDTRLVIELCEATSDESDDPMIEIRRIKK